jgi:CHAD domain-containing protein
VASKANLASIVPTPKIGLDAWMGKTLELAETAAKDFDADAVHDLRVAMRRCRTMADALAEVNPDPGWRKMKKASKPVFQDLGKLRDCQIEQEWVKKVGGRGDAFRRHMLRQLGEKEKRLKLESAGSLGGFERKEWKKLQRKLSTKAQFFPPESVVYQRLALARVNEAVELFDRARRGKSRVAWHRLRIGLKRFRYTLENFLPVRGAEWLPELKELQDALGDVHDLDVLRAESRRHSDGWDLSVTTLWLEKIERVRRETLDKAKARLLEKDATFGKWRAGLQNGRALAAGAGAGAGVSVAAVTALVDRPA